MLLSVFRRLILSFALAWHGVAPALAMATSDSFSPMAICTNGSSKIIYLPNSPDNKPSPPSHSHNFCLFCHISAAASNDTPISVTIKIQRLHEQLAAANLPRSANAPYNPQSAPRAPPA